MSRWREVTRPVRERPMPVSDELRQWHQAGTKSPQSHWEAVYRGKGERETSWFRERLDTSLAPIDGLAPDRATPVIGVGGGRSTLVDDLLARGYTDLSVLDLSESALAQVRERLGAAGATVAWHVAEVTNAALPDAHHGLWHERAVFHSLIEEEARAAYLAQAARAVRPGAARSSRLLRRTGRRSAAVFPCAGIARANWPRPSRRSLRWCAICARSMQRPGVRCGRSSGSCWRGPDETPCRSASHARPRTVSPRSRMRCAPTRQETKEPKTC